MSRAHHDHSTVTLAQFTANQDNLSFSNTYDMIRISSDAARNLTGLAGGRAGRCVVLINQGGFSITLVEQATSAAVNQIITGTGANRAITATYGSAQLVYDGTSSRWRVIACT